MRKEEFAEALGEINEKHILEARAERKAKKPVWLKWSAMAACLCLAILITLPHIPTSDDTGGAHIVAPALPGIDGNHSGKVVTGEKTDVYLSGDVIMEIGFTHAGVQSTDVQNMMLTMDDNKKPFHFDLKFFALGNWHEYEINAITGEILTVEIQPSDGNDIPINPAEPIRPSEP